MKIFILAGGGGERLWPLSRNNFPKQFLHLNGSMSLLQQTVDRFLGAVSPEDVIVITNHNYQFHVSSALNSLPGMNGSGSGAHMVLEPLGRNTAPAIALGMNYCREKLGCTEDEIIFLSPSDHIIKPPEAFAEQVKQAEEIAKKGYLVTFGIRPDKPETGFGYLKFGAQLSGNGTQKFFKVERFAEKPDRDTAKRYIREGNYYWNSGMFAFRIRTMTEELQRYAPEIMKLYHLGYEEMLSQFEQMPNISIDYAVMEKSDKVAALPFELYWNDVGSWDSLFDILDKDGNGNVFQGDVMAIDTKDSFLAGKKRLIAAVGLENCLVVETDDAILIAKKGEAQKVKDIVKKLKEHARPEAVEHVTTYRPWGNYTVLENGPRYKIKRIVVNPNEKLSLQMHYHRSEHWVVVKGSAKVTTGGKESFIHENESAYIPKSTMHRLENPGKIPLEIIEVQNGEYLGEDDIVRFDDVYGRTGGDGNPSHPS
ncbi:MAG: mannose-1-phosphate guanylyltransferase/mannose-6-phosphate isomerase [Candidatus Brocadia sp.]|nr:Alginate biosynthesis protein AlgA [Candidatus Brocadia fulgida]MCC6325505.1 mannose-1-phosphate guanylyltransferase/mannose-6-phosphate isomerase [Candidatus Brocadia sp.]MCE7910218.1 mannose-1-phosphate guanylyltransferase/mannose-6-phosphate isomerase [Candidatus Brocadia sp. AMX3]MDG5996819.1 mannose-1-phosphate guanylyltransferase/mannose-6-phosphate isomerase [Candidatus Brocadia sp.]RIK03341.1 MAG: mannose-1-phosphate guanylyltransferase/mannose-6-phosphate isomerase [Candidatus Broca